MGAFHAKGFTKSKYLSSSKSLTLCQVNVFQAKTELSKLLVMLEDKSEDEIIIARNGTPVAKLVRREQAPASRRIGIAADIFSVPETIDEDNAEIARLFSDDLG